MQISADIPSAKKYCAQLNWCSTTLKSEWKINNKKRHYSHNAVQLNSISIKHSARRKFSMYRYWANVTTVQIAIYIYISGWMVLSRKENHLRICRSLEAMISGGDVDGKKLSHDVHWCMTGTFDLKCLYWIERQQTAAEFFITGYGRDVKACCYSHARMITDHPLHFSAMLTILFCIHS